MPDQLSSHVKPILTDEQAWDIAAYINSMPRPEKRFKNDWPDISKKPIDLPFGPYADHFTEEQHKYGPYKEIVATAKANGTK
jgi:thiosulfate dehydrogenase